MENTAGESGAVPVDVNRRQDIGFQLPPPYSTEPLIPVPSNYFDSSVPNSTLNVFNENLHNGERFSLVPMGRLNSTGNIFVQLQNTAQQPIMSIKTVPELNNSTGFDHSIRVGSVIQITNTFGQLLIAAKQTGESIAVSSGDQVIGMVEGMYNTSLFATGVLGEMLFYSIGSANSYEFTLMSNGGVALARIERTTNDSGGCSITLFNTLNIDSRTKALLLFTGYLMYCQFVQEAIFRKLFARQNSTFARTVLTYIFYIVVLGLLLSIPVIILATR